MDILVTGGTGLLGSHLLYKLLADDNKVVAIIRLRNKITQIKKIFSYYSNDANLLLSNIKWIEGDILDAEFLKEICRNIDTVYHLAAFVSYNKRNKEKIFKVNVQGTQNIIDACLMNSVKKLCFVSSTSTLGSRIGNSIINEESQFEINKHTSNYALSKYEAEKLVLNAQKKGLSVSIINPSIILGAGDWNSSSSKMFLKSWKSSFYNLCQHSKCEGLGRVGFCPIQFSSKLLQQLFIIFSFQHMLHILICIIVDVHKFQIILFSIYQNRLVCLF